MKIKSKGLENIYKPKGYNQEKYVNYLDDNNVNIILVVGPAGTGKTLFACIKAITMLKKGLINKVILTRPVVTVEEDIGFLPGNIVKKMDPWTKPIFDIFMEYYSKSEIDNMVNSNVIEISPLAFMRGRTFKNAFIIADEMQNSSPSQMKMLTTRIGVNSKMVITGDLEQSDRDVNNGLSDLIQKIDFYEKNNNITQNVNSIQKIHFNNSDIERSPIVEKIINIYEFKKTLNQFNTNPLNTIVKKYENKTSNNNYDAALIPREHRFRKIWEEY